MPAERRLIDVDNDIYLWQCSSQGEPAVRGASSAMAAAPLRHHTRSR
jgi:hypothetical protein